MSSRSAWSCLCLFVAVLSLVGCGGTSSATDGGTDAGGSVGQTLYTNTCSSCHGATGAGGLGSNITGSATAGIGNWTQGQFTNAVRNGVGIQGQTLCATMTRFTTSALSDGDLTSILEYLVTQKSDTATLGTACH